MKGPSHAISIISPSLSGNDRRQFLLIRAQNEIIFDAFITRFSNSYNKNLLYFCTPEVFSTCWKCCDLFILTRKVQVITFHLFSLQLENTRTFCIILNFVWEHNLFAQFGCWVTFNSVCTIYFGISYDFSYIQQKFPSTSLAYWFQ
jgi:hypothetical protein